MITQKELKALITYDKDSGNFYRVNTNKLIQVNPDRDGHIRFRVKNIKIYAHRLAWIYITGSFPENCIDHIDGNPSNNKFTNLREATNKENSRNSKMFKTNTSGVKGVYWHKGKSRWYAHCRVDNKRHFVGTFKNIIDAEKAVNAFREKHHGAFANHGK